jgi:hypothetical protein
MGIGALYARWEFGTIVSITGSFFVLVDWMSDALLLLYRFGAM